MRSPRIGYTVASAPLFPRNLASITAEGGDRAGQGTRYGDTIGTQAAEKPNQINGVMP
jgi:hypothetical protein